MSSLGTKAQENRAADATRPRRMTLRDITQIVFFAVAVRLFMMLFIGLRVRGREHLNGPGPFILIANHSSHLDTASLLSLFPLMRLRDVRPVAAADYFERNAVVRTLTRAFFNILPIARKNITPENNPLRRMKEALDAGYSLLIFPEGTRGSGEEMGKFRSGVAHLLEQAPGVPVVPAYLVNMGRSLPKGAFIPVPFFCEVRLGAPCIIQGTRQEMIQELEAAVRELKEMD
ncbi:MAG TPA: lysophospholipid acyltransferase family protein [Blastocatellia bacterium]|nr:lysophospholipid acyltransferase family protein [Blastocatellia bacterium]